MWVRVSCRTTSIIPYKKYVVLSVALVMRKMVDLARVIAAEAVKLG